MVSTLLGKFLDSKALLFIVTLCFLASVFATELLPFLFGTGDAASVDWSLVYVTFRFVILPIGSVFLLVWGLQQFRSGLRLREGAILWQAAFGIFVASVFVGLSLAMQLPWLWVAVHGLDGPTNVRGWLQ
jgi:hypothetical protein